MGVGRGADVPEPLVVLGLAHGRLIVETNLRQDAMVQAFNYKAGLLRTAMRGSGA